MNNLTAKEVQGSFRDPSGFLFYQNGSIYRQVSFVYRENYDYLINSGLYRILIKENFLISHREVKNESKKDEKAYKIIKPELISFISYPYEWSFSQLKDAALTTLKIQKKSLEHGMSLKDCSAYNIQFKECRPIFIDSLSFEKYREGQPWVAYRQFCQHFLAPLALASYKDIRLNQLMQIFIDGIPLDLASLLLPPRTYFNFSLLSHIHLHAQSQKHFANKKINKKRGKLNLLSLLALIDNLESTVKKLKFKPKDTEWSDYYQDTNYSKNALNHKKRLVTEFLDKIKPETVWDLGANNGLFSRISSNRGIQTISFDSDPVCVEKNYLECRKKREKNILPLLINLTNPSPNIGWNNQERESLINRGPADAVLVLALIHHLSFSNNLPFNKISNFFTKICRYLIIEFIPKTDSQAKRLLLNREDIFFNYNQDFFVSEFSKYFKILMSVNIKGTKRVLYLMQKR